MPKRKLQKRELYFFIRVADLKVDGGLKRDRHYHIVREGASGQKYGACDIAKTAISGGHGYYLVPYMVFLARCLDPYICAFCYEQIATDLTPVSHTGVNFSSAGDK